MTAHTYRTLDVAVDGGMLRVGEWLPEHPDPRWPPVVLIHGVTSSHAVWPFVVAAMPGVHFIAPDLRGRGRSNRIAGHAGMRAHARDLDAMMADLGVDDAVIVGHSMGAFVAVAFSHLHPSRVSRLVLVDGGLPLDVPKGVDADTLVAAILGPTAARLSMRFDTVEDYWGFWRDHPAFIDAWTPELERYFAYDLVDDGAGSLRPATSYETTVDDTVDMNAGDVLQRAIAGLSLPTRMITVPRGLQNEEPGLYAPDHLRRLLENLAHVRHLRVSGYNHYTIVLSAGGAAHVAEAIRQELGARVE